MVTAFAAVTAKAIQNVEKTAGADEQATTNVVRPIFRPLKV